LSRASQLIRGVVRTLGALSGRDEGMRLDWNARAQDVLRAALPEAQAWCVQRVSPQPAWRLDEPDPTLRSIRLCPSLFAVDPNRMVRSVVDSRSSALESGAAPKGARLALAGGRLLFYEPSKNLADGAACAQSRGFFDVDNTPPWDTWVCFADDTFVVSWVPPECLDRASAGVAVNPEECIRWASDVKSPFAAFLRSEGLLA